MNTAAIALSTLLLCSGSACLAQAQDDAARRMDRIDDLVKGKLVEVDGMVFRAIRIDRQESRADPMAFVVHAMPLIEVDQQPGPKDDEGRPEHFDLTIEGHRCRVPYRIRVDGKLLRVLIGKSFVHWKDALAMQDHRREFRRFMPPARMTSADIAKASQCDKHENHDHPDMPLAALEIYSGNQLLGAEQEPRRDTSLEAHATKCQGPLPITRVVLTPSPGSAGRFNVNIRAVSGLQCKWADRTRETAREFKQGLSEPVEMTAHGNIFTLDDFAALWRMPAFPEYTGAELAAALGEPVDEATCEPLLSGHRVTVDYDGQSIYSYDLYPLPHCVKEDLP